MLATVSHRLAFVQLLQTVHVIYSIRKVLM